MFKVYKHINYTKDIVSKLPNATLKNNSSIKFNNSFKWSLNDLLPVEQSYFSFISPNNNKCLLILYENSVKIPDVFNRIISEGGNQQIKSQMQGWRTKPDRFTNIDKLPNIALFYTYNVDSNNQINEGKTKEKFNDKPRIIYGKCCSRNN